jgi:hypothetical protein
MLVVLLLFTNKLISNSGNICANLLQQIVYLQIHFEDGLLATLVVQGDNKCSGRRGGYVEVDIRPPVFAPSGAKRKAQKCHTNLLSGTLLSTMMPSFSSWACVNRYGPRATGFAGFFSSFPPTVTTPTPVVLPLSFDAVRRTFCR